MLYDFFFYNIIAINLGFILDLVFGDPNYSWHPIIIIGKLNKMIEKKLYDVNSKFKGSLLVISSILIILIIMVSIMYLSYNYNKLIYLLINTLITYQIIATNSLNKASFQVYLALDKNDIKQARYALSMIVARDTSNLSEEKIVNACVETVLENTSDGISAPLFYLALGGPVLGLVYKDINTFDSMIGYKNDKYLNFGWFAAKLDDLVNLIPARLSALVMIVSSVLLRYDYTNAFKTYLSDRYNHTSPNAGHLEAVGAGALNLQLGGPNIYFDKQVNKPYIGKKNKISSKEDIIKANKLMKVTCCLFVLGIDVVYYLFLI